MATQTLEQFGASIKSKYSQYSDISDAELGQRMLQKFPQYQDIVKQDEFETPGILGKVGSFLGVEKLGRRIGAEIGKLVSPSTDKALKDLVQKGQMTPEEYKNISTLGVSNKEALGSAIETAATIGTAGIASGAKLGVKAIAKTGAKLAGAGAAAGFGRGLSEDKNLQDSLGQAFTTGVASAATFGVLAGAGKLTSKVLEKLPTRIFASVAKLETQSAKALLDAKQVGTLGKLKGFADKEAGRLDKLIQARIVKNNGSINTKKMLNDVINSTRKEFTGVSKEKILRGIKEANVEQLLKKKSVDYLTADKLRQELGKTIGFAWKTDNPPLNKAIRMNLWKGLVNTYRTPTKTNQLFKQYAPLVKASSRLGKVMANQEKKFGFSLYDYIGGGFGFAGGGIPGAIAATTARKVAGSPVAKTAAAVGLNELSNILKKIPTDNAGRISRTALVNAFKQLGEN